MESKAVTKFNKIQKEIATEYIKGAVKYPLRLLTILMLAGMPATKAQLLIFNIKNGMKRSANIEIRRQLLNLLKSLIDICTSDTTIYARLRNLALNHKLGGIKEEVKVYFECLNITNKTEITEDIKKELEELLIPIEEDVQGVAGTGLGSVGGNSPSPTQGIDSYDPVLTPMIRIFKKTKKKG